MSLNAQRTINWVEQGYIPDNIIRKGIQRLLKVRLKEIHADNAEELSVLKNSFINEMRKAPIAMVPEKANEQHYEVPAKFYDLVLGKHNKYSCCFWDEDTKSLNQAEDNALAIMKNTDMHIFDLEDIGPHYARTLKDWRERFFQNESKIRELGYSDTFIRLWEFYLCYCEGGFMERSISTVHLLLTKPDCRRPPFSYQMPV